MLPLISFETGRKTQTQSCWAANAAPANGSLVLLLRKEPRPRGQHTRRRIRKEFTPALLRKRVGRAFALLTKTYHGSRVTGKVEPSTGPLRKIFNPTARLYRLHSLSKHTELPKTRIRRTRLRDAQPEEFFGHTRLCICRDPHSRPRAFRPLFQSGEPPTSL